MTNPDHISNSLASTHWAVSNSDESPENLLSDDLVMAWAEDQANGEPRYIGELGVNQRGSKCNCRCISCKLPLTAVNAAKTKFQIRPHFRHPTGAEKNACLVLAARFAALQMLKSEGVLELPRHRQSARVTGLSGKYYEAWVESPPERVRISSFRFNDKASAILTLDDGRKLSIRLVGRLEAKESETDLAVSLTPTILLIVDDPSIAAMSPAELRKRLRLISVDGIWCSYWNNKALIDEAMDAAKREAEVALDWLGDIPDFPVDISANLKRETLLHLKAKEILDREKRICLPSFDIEAETVLPNGRVLTRTKMLPGHIAELESVTLEKRIGRIRPDVVAKAITSGEWLAEQILIEITVTNTITEERIERIRRENIPALEIDISRMGGVVTEAEFTHLVVDELAGKRWLFHPQIERERSLLEHELSNEAAEIIEQERQYSEAISTPVGEWVRLYLESVMSHGNIRAHADDSVRDSALLERAISLVRKYAKNLSAHGYPEANDDELFRQRGNILERLLSLKLNKAVGYKLDSAWQVINAILQEKPPYSQWQSLYLMGIKTWRPTLNEEQTERVSKWRADVLRSLNAGERTFQRDRKYDRLLTLLFPELATALSKSLGNSSSNTQPETTGQPQSTNSAQGAVNTNYRNHPSDPWLRGKALEAWKRDNPESAKQWEEMKSKFKLRY